MKEKLEVEGNHYVWKLAHAHSFRNFWVSMAPHLEMDTIQAVNKSAGDYKKDSASAHSSQDPEKNIQVGSGPELQRRLKSRHLQMIAIGSLFFMDIRLLPSRLYSSQDDDDDE